MRDQGIWLKGDWHIHSRHSKDSTFNPISAITRHAKKVGLDYVAITDHDVHVGGDVAGHTWADPDFAASEVTIFHGGELTAPRGHINILHHGPYDHQRVFDNRNARDWDLLALKQELGIHVSANHLVTKNHYGFSFDIADSVEIWNGSSWPKNIPGLRVWDDQLLSGRILPARGGSDAHHGLPEGADMTRPQSIEAMANYVGTPTTWVYASDTSKAAILQALEAGRSTVSANYNAPRAEMSAHWSGHDLFMGENTPAPGSPVTLCVKLSEGRVPGARYRVRIIKNRNILTELWTDPGTGQVTLTDTPTEQCYYRAEIEGPQTPCPEVPLSMTESGHMVALTGPIYFGYDPEF